MERGGGAGTAAAVANSTELGVQVGGARAGGVEVGRVSRREGEEEFEVGCVLRCVCAGGRGSRWGVC